MIKKIILALLLTLIYSCKGTKTIKYFDRHALVANVNSKNSLLVYSFWKDKEYAIKIEDLKTGKILFYSEIKDKCYTEPQINREKLFFPESNDTFTCFDYKKNKLLWKLHTKGRIREFQFVKDNIIVASIEMYGLIAINTETGKVLYEVLIDSNNNCANKNAPRPIGFDRIYFYLADFNCAKISAYEISSGKKVWSKSKDTNGLSNFIITDKYIFIGTNDNYERGNIELLDAKTGTLLYSENSKFEIMMNPILNQDKVIYYTYDSQLNQFDTKKKISKVIFKFSTTDDISGNQIYQLDNFIYFNDKNFNLNRINLVTLKKDIIGKSPKGLLGVYEIKNEVKFVY